MKRHSSRRITLGRLLILVAAIAVVLSLLRSPEPPNEGEAIVLAKEYLVAHGDYDYPHGYWVRTQWNQGRESWRVGFKAPGKKEGPSLMVEVDRDRSCRSAQHDYAFFQE
jgi:hypothetical protein